MQQRGERESSAMILQSQIQMMPQSDCRGSCHGHLKDAGKTKDRALPREEWSQQLKRRTP